MPWQFPKVQVVYDNVIDFLQSMSPNESTINVKSRPTSVNIKYIMHGPNRIYGPDEYKLYLFEINQTTGEIDVAYSQGTLYDIHLEEPPNIDPSYHGTSRDELDDDGQSLYDIIDGLKELVDEDPSSNESNNTSASGSGSASAPAPAPAPASASTPASASATNVSNDPEAGNTDPSLLNASRRRRNQSKRKRRSSRRGSRKHRQRSRK